MADLVKITDYAARMVAALLQQFRGKERIEAYLKHVLAPKIQEIEDVATAIQGQLSPDLAAGDLLDKLGSVVGQTRLPGEADAAYRLKVKARMARNRSKATREDVLLVAKLVTPTAKWAKTTVIQIYPLGLIVQVLTTSDLTAEEKSILKEFLEGTRGQTVALSVVVAPAVGAFGFENNTLGALGFDVGKFADLV